MHRITRDQSPRGGLFRPGFAWVSSNSGVTLRFDPKPVVDRVTELLFAPEVSFGRLDRYMPE